MFKLKIEKKGQPTVEVSYYDRLDAFTAAISHFQAEKDYWGEGYLYAARRYVTIESLAAKPFSFWGDGEGGMRITITDEKGGGVMLKYLQTGVIYFFTDSGQAAYSPDGYGFVYFDDLDEAQTETGITKVIQTTEKEFEDTYEQG